MNNRKTQVASALGTVNYLQHHLDKTLKLRERSLLRQYEWLRVLKFLLELIYRKISKKVMELKLKR